MIGRGSFGDVFKGILTPTNGKGEIAVAIKRIAGLKYKNILGLKQQLNNERRCLEHLKSDNITRLLAYAETKNNMYFVLELCNGGTLGELIACRPNKKLKEEEVRVVFRQVAEALTVLHELDYCHRDMKLENILIDIHSQGATQGSDETVTNQFKATMPITRDTVTVKICDLGLVREHNDKQSFLKSFKGTEPYMAPEIHER